MMRSVLSGACRCLVLAGAALCFLGTVELSGTPQTPSPPPAPSPPNHRRTKKPTWHNGPATIVPETEVVPPHGSSMPPPVRDVTLSTQGERRTGGKPGSSSTGGTLAKPPVAGTEPAANLDNIDPQKRALGELNCLRTNADARQSFYAELRRTVQRVRAGRNDEAPAEKKAVACRQ